MPNVAELQIQIRRGTEAEWESADPVLLLGEIGWATDSNDWKIGDGATAWTLLDRMNPNPISPFLLMGA